jgi:hypothetical protein
MCGIRVSGSASPRVTPMTRLPVSRPWTSRATSVPAGGAPTTAQAPRGASASTAVLSTAERGEDLEVRFRIHPDHAAFVGERVLREGGLAEEAAAEIAAVAGDGDRAVVAHAADQVARQPGHAVGGVTAAARRAPAARREAQQHLVTGNHPADAAADPFEDPGAFVPEDAGQLERDAPGLHGEIGVAQAGGTPRRPGAERTGRGSAGHQAIAMSTDLVWRYSSRPSGPPSRP